MNIIRKIKKWTQWGKSKTECHEDKKEMNLIKIIKT